MKFYIKPKHFAQYRSFKIRDEQQGELFKIKGKFVFGLRKLWMKDMNDERLYTLERKFCMKGHRKYEVLNELSEVVAQIQRTYGKKPKYTLSMSDNTMHFEGTVYEHKFSLHDENEALAKIEKKDFDFGEAYEVEILTERKPLLHLFLVVAIDQMNHERKKFRS